MQRGTNLSEWDTETWCVPERFWASGIPKRRQSAGRRNAVTRRCRRKAPQRWTVL